MALITTSYSTNAINQMVAEPGFYTTGPVTGATPLGTTNGGSRFSAGQTIETLQIDGVPSGVVGLERISGYAPTLSTNFLEFGPEDLKLYFGQGNDWIGSAPKVLTPPDVNSFLASGSYLLDLRFWTKRSDGKWLALWFSAARVEAGEWTFSDKEQPIPVTFRALNVGTDLTTLRQPPFHLEEHDSAPTRAVGP